MTLYYGKRYFHRGFMKMGNFPWIIIRFLGITGSVGFYDNFHILYIFSRIFKNS